MQERGWGRGQIPQPELRSPTDLLSQLIKYFTINKQDYRTLFSEKLRLHPITDFAYGLGDMWLHPIIDFSIPPDRVSQQIPAWEFLKLPNNSPQFKHINRQVVTIAPGAYGDEPGVSIGKEDVFSLPLAVSYWPKQQNISTSQRFLTGGEAHGYMFHNYLTQRSIVPIPDLWMIGLAAVLGKALAQGRLLKGRRGIIVQVPLADIQSSNLDRKPVYLIDKQIPPVDAVITSVSGNQAKVWLGGLDYESLAAFGQDAVFNGVGGTGEVKLQSRQTNSKNGQNWRSRSGHR